MRAVRSQQHGRAVCGLGALGEKKVFFGDFLSPDKKLPAPWSESSGSYERSNNNKRHPHPNPLPPAGEGEKHKRDFSVRKNDNRTSALRSWASSTAPP